MKSTRFDSISRALGSRSNRRQLGARSALGGLALALGARAGAAQDEHRTCNFELVATVATGPHTGTTYQGALTLPIGSAGAIEEGSFTPQGGVPARAVGHATDRAIHLRIVLGEDGVLVLTGVARRLLAGCRGELSGIFGGPAMGDLGTWTVNRRSAGASSPTSTATSGGAATRTPCPPVDCGQTLVQNPETCECGCAGRSEQCGDQCCPGGSICDAPNQSCQCPPGTEICNDVCVPPCPTAESLDPTTCECRAGCGSVTCQYSGTIGQVLDPATCSCVDFCVDPFPYFCGGTCNGEPMAFCNGGCYTAASTNSDPNLCGLSCAVCPPGVPCIGGSCQCPFGYSLCPSGCSDLSETYNCGSCGMVCPQGIFCTQGVCCSPSGIFAQCSFDADCCSGACYHDSVANVTYCL